MCDCPACTSDPLRFYGGPADGMTISTPRVQTVQVPAVFDGGVVVTAVYKRFELSTGPAMVCECAWPIRKTAGGT